MNKKVHQSLRVTLLVIPSLLLLTACTTDGGVSAGDKGKAPIVTNSENQYVSVTGSAGQEPKLGTPQGSAPLDLYSRDLIEGKGAVAAATSTLTVHYVLASWSTGKVIQSSWTTGSPATFPLAQVIPGWQKGMPGMKEGGRRLLVIPPALGYGAQGAGPIGPNETLIFVVDLVKVA
jgi:peptidylprolyl isomerase